MKPKEQQQQQQQQQQYRTHALLSVCAYISTGRKPALISEKRL